MTLLAIGGWGWGLIGWTALIVYAYKWDHRP